MKAKLTSKGQITIPLAIRQRLNLKTGQIFEFDEDAPFLKATKVVDEKRMRSVFGVCKSDDSQSTTELLNDLRGKVK